MNCWGLKYETQFMKSIASTSVKSIALLLLQCNLPGMSIYVTSFQLLPPPVPSNVKGDPFCSFPAIYFFYFGTPLE